MPNVELRFSVNELRTLFEQYHKIVHPNGSMVCSHCKGDPSLATTFLDWLEERQDEDKFSQDTLDKMLAATTAVFGELQERFQKGKIIK